jgi:hypothetical protein
LDGHALTSFVMSAHQQLPAAIKVILFELRSHAKAVLSGHAKASLPVAAPEPVLKLVEAPPVKEIVALRNFRYIGVDGAVRVVGQLQRHDMPAGLADAAMRAGAACAVGDPRVAGGKIGSRGGLLPDETRCEWIGPAKAEPAPSAYYRPAIPHSSLGNFEIVDRGPPLVGTMRTTPVEPEAAGARSMPEEES